MGSIDENLRIAMWRRLTYHDPEETLRKFRDLQRLLLNSTLPDRIKDLRLRELRSAAELRQAVLFAHGLGGRLRLKVYVASYEDADYDAVCLWRHDETEHFAPVQLKELPPHNTNQHATLQEQLSKLSKYTDSADLQVVIYLNRTAHIEFSKLEIPKVNIGGIWLVGSVSPDHSRWVLIGDLKNGPEATYFDHPGATPEPRE